MKHVKMTLIVTFSDRVLQDLGMQFNGSSWANTASNKQERVIGWSEQCRGVYPRFESRRHATRRRTTMLLTTTKVYT